MFKILGLFLLAGLVLAATNSFWAAPVVGAVQNYHRGLADPSAEQPTHALVAQKEEK